MKLKGEWTKKKFETKSRKKQLATRLITLHSAPKFLQIFENASFLNWESETVPSREFSYRSFFIPQLFYTDYRLPIVFILKFFITKFFTQVFTDLCIFPHLQHFVHRRRFAKFSSTISDLSGFGTNGPQCPDLSQKTYTFFTFLHEHNKHFYITKI